MSAHTKNRYLFNAFKMGVLPNVFYFLCFIALTYPAILSFSSHFFADNGDGLQNVWNLWWVNKAVTELGQLPWHTSYLHFPKGTTLLGQTMNPFNGFLGIPLQKFLSLTQTYNFIVIFSFVTGGLTAFWLAYYFTKSYGASLVAGYIFTFCSYHFAHAEGHLQLVALEFIPLFVLCWYHFVQKPGVRIALGSALVLFLVILCDYYYFMFCVMTGMILVGWEAFRRKQWFFWIKPPYLTPMLVFIGGVLGTSGVLLAAFFNVAINDPFVQGHHWAYLFSLDPLALFIPGGHWRFSDWTSPYWLTLPGNPHEQSVHIGISVTVLLIYVWWKRWDINERSISFWFLLFLIFVLLALGPNPQLMGKRLDLPIMPYAAAELVFPVLKLGGTPVRMVLISILAASVLVAFGIKWLARSRLGRYRWIPIFLVVMVFEYLPYNIPQIRIPPPPFINYLNSQPGNEAIYDSSERYLALYHQTLHERPMAFGEVSRLTKSSFDASTELKDVAESYDFARLYREFKLRFLVYDTGRNHIIIDLERFKNDTPFQVRQAMAGYLPLRGQ